MTLGGMYMENFPCRRYVVAQGVFVKVIRRWTFVQLQPRENN